MARSRRRRLEKVTLHEPEPRYWTNGRFAIQRSIAPESRLARSYPLGVTALFRLGDDRSYVGLELTWADVEAMHQQLGHALADRAAYGKAIERAKARKL
ncbi:MAG: hypothetical protein E6G97_02085 [Alphaproteobacteria bacterium]|nr:MAG: hypothetical protein E6G97_02085 [Alphaproteobacteria bacterium]